MAFLVTFVATDKSNPPEAKRKGKKETEEIEIPSVPFYLKPPLLPLRRRSWLSPLKRLIHQYNVVPELLHALPRNVKILPPPEQPEKPARPEYDQRLHRPLRDLHLHVAHAPQPASVTQVDDLLAPQQGEPAHHLPSLPSYVCFHIYARRGPSHTVEKRGFSPPGITAPPPGDTAIINR